MSILTESLADKIRNLPDETPSATGARNRHSHVVGPAEPPLRHVTVADALRESAERYPTHDCVVIANEERRLSYRAFESLVDDIAAGFLALGIEKGDRVGIWSPNRLEWVLTQFATARVGAILVNINPAYRLTELEYALNKVSCRALVTASSFKSSNYLDMIRTLAPELADCDPGELVSAKLPHLTAVAAMTDDPGPGVLRFNDLADMGSSAQKLRLNDIARTLEPSDPINIQFTSGTTGAPKGATLTHDNIVNNARFVTGRINFTQRDRLCIPVPLYHCFGMVMGVLGCITKGAAMIFPGEGFSAPETLAAISRYRCTATYGVPTMFIAMLEEMKQGSYDLSALRTGIMAGATCPIEVMERVINEMNMREVTICYGMTETSPVSFQSFVDDPVDKRVTTVGRVHPHLEVKIVDREGEMVPVGEKGELCTRGYSVMHGYWEDAERTRESIIEGWMHSGDLATLDEEGFCTIVGRVKDMIIRGGENIYPREVEEFLFRHPDIAQAQVFGIPDNRYGEQVCAWIVPRTGTSLTGADVIDFCTDQITHFKIPRHVRIVDELPMTVTGKPQKFIMREQMIALLEQDSTPEAT